MPESTPNAQPWPELAAAVDAARRSNLAVLAGAGLSMLPPSTLPSWADFVGALLDEAIDSAAAAPFLDGPAVAAIRSLSASAIGTGTLSEAITKYVAGVAYYPVLSALDGTEVNANHWALAELARRGSLRAIVTPNFDTLIERAFGELGVPLSAAATGPEDTCALVRVHGVATATRTMIDTVEQKARGLPYDTHEALHRCLTGRHVLVVGFSGLDLDFAADYLSLESMDLAGVTWIVRSRSPVPPQVEHLRVRLAGRLDVVEGALPGLWSAFGLDVPPDTLGDAAQAAAATARIRDTVRAMYSRLGPSLAVSLCMRLLQNSGHGEQAGVVYRRLSACAHEWIDPDQPGQITVLRALSSTDGLTSATDQLAWQEKDVAGCRRALATWVRTSSEVRARIDAGLVDGRVRLAYPFDVDLDASGWRILDRTVKQELDFVLAIGAGNLALSYTRLERLRDAVASTDEAFHHSLLSADPRSLAAYWYAQALIHEQRHAPDSLTLWTLLLAEAAAVAGGNVDTAFMAALVRAQVLLRAGEYYQAADSLDRAERRASLTGRRAHLAQALAQRAHLASRRHQLADALRLLETALEAAGDMPDVQALVRWNRVCEFSHERELRQVVLDDCAWLLQADAGVLGGVSGLPDPTAVREIRERVARSPELPPLPSGAPSMEVWKGWADEATKGLQPPPFLADVAVEGAPPATQLRHLLITNEYVHDRAGVAGVLTRMTESTLDAGNDDPRAEELARALVDASEGLDDGSRVRARLLYSEAAARLGDLDRARDAVRGLERLVLAFDAGLERRRKTWLATLEAAVPGPKHPYLLIRDIASGLPALRVPARDRLQAAESLVEAMPQAAQILLCHLAQEFRGANDWRGLARCYESLARSASALGRPALAAELAASADTTRA